MKQNNNIENQFRQKLNQRSIEPSDKAWDRLDAMLSVSEKQKPNRTWLWIAASLVTFITIGSLFLKIENNNLDSEQEVVMSTETEVKAEPLEVLDNNLEKQVSVTDSFVIKKPIVLTPKKDEKITENIALTTTEEIPVQTENIKKTTSNKYISAESLLAQIEKEQPQETRKLQPKTNIDANILLVNTIKEMDETHQNNAFKDLQNQFKTIKEALSDRNKE